MLMMMMFLWQYSFLNSKPIQSEDKADLYPSKQIKQTKEET
jgi:hypothetical protein